MSEQTNNIIRFNYSSDPTILMNTNWVQTNTDTEKNTVTGVGDFYWRTITFDFNGKAPFSGVFRIKVDENGIPDTSVFESISGDEVTDVLYDDSDSLLFNGSEAGATLTNFSTAIENTVYTEKEVAGTWSYVQSEYTITHYWRTITINNTTHTGNSGELKIEVDENGVPIYNGYIVHNLIKISGLDNVAAVYYRSNTDNLEIVDSSLNKFICSNFSTATENTTYNSSTGTSGTDAGTWSYTSSTTTGEYHPYYSIEMYLNNDVTEFPRLFMYDYSLTSIEFDTYSVTTLGEYAFHHCINLTSILLPDNLIVIDEFAIATCTSLTNILIPELVETIGSAALQGSNGLQVIDYNAINCTSVADSSFGIGYNLTTVNIGENVTSIPRNIFTGKTSITTINYNAINCEAHVYKPFASCTGVTTVNIGENVTSIPYNIFSDCSNISNIECLSETPPTVSSGAFYPNIIFNLSVHVDSLQDYINSNWSGYVTAVSTIETPAYDNVLKFNCTEDPTTFLNNLWVQSCTDTSANTVVSIEHTKTAYWRTITFDFTGKSTYAGVFRIVVDENGVPVEPYNLESISGDSVEYVSYSVDNDILSFSNKEAEATLIDFSIAIENTVYTEKEGTWSYVQSDYGITHYWRTITITDTSNPSGSGIIKIEVNENGVPVSPLNYEAITSYSDLAQILYDEKGDYLYLIGPDKTYNIAISSFSVATENTTNATDNKSGDEGTWSYVASTTTEPSVITYYDYEVTLYINSTLNTFETTMFADNENITSVEFDYNVTSIIDDAFNGCENLLSVTLTSTVPPTIGEDTFSLISPDAVLYVPNASIPAYQTAGFGDYFGEIRGMTPVPPKRSGFNVSGMIDTDYIIEVYKRR